MTKNKIEGATWATVTLAMPQLVEWQIEGDAASKSGSSLRDFVTALAAASEGRETVVRVNLVLSL
ncbi:hypothetical protein M3484_03835 [Pseudomonas sp. GX19020]|uniref:hypothetical protein n=1 Tax=Pseudomonas sp. GX19020 TaxID=2942277 RepID=UPI002019D246|nr:hypothetical protein [Pseudomonas sp. GX19020]MCL4065698.1 hypothetical protein [Pseudomonas sp. GX19020]